jgi:predicted metal-dependent peptidase
MDKILYSTSELLFCNRSFWFKTDNAWVEENSILSAITRGSEATTSFFGSYGYGEKTPRDFIGNNFWKYFSRRIWQKDDFKFKKAAAVSYVPTANRYKIKFNPLRMYEMHISSILEETMGGADLKNYLAKVAEKIAEDKEITSEVPGVNFKLLKMLYDCSVKGEWDETSFRWWGMALITDDALLRNMVSAFIHEYLHIILNHISGRQESKDMRRWNYATDFAINQSCIFTGSIKKVLITPANKKWFKKFVISAIAYQYKTDDEMAQKINQLFTINQDDVYSDIQKHLPTIKGQFDRDPAFMLNCYLGKSADEYYRILAETPPPEENEGEESGYDDHAEWDTVDVEMDEEVEAEDSEDGEDDEDDAEAGDEEEKDKESKSSNGDATPAKEEGSERGKKFSGENAHQGFDALDNATQRSEARSALKESLKRSGVDMSDFNEVLKGLNSIPGLDKFGAELANFFKVKTKNWKQMLQNFMSLAINVSEADFTMSRENRIKPDYFPGKKMERGLDCILGMDTSGSIGGSDWNDFCNQVVRISKDFNADKLRVMQCHTRVSFDGMVNISKIHKMFVRETGGTIMQVLFERLKAERNKKPVILFTDGEIDYFPASQYNFKILMFLSRGHSRYKPVLESLGHKVICQDEE